MSYIFAVLYAKIIDPGVHCAVVVATQYFLELEYFLGQFLVQCVGEVVSEAEFNSRWVENYFSQSHHYALQLEAGRIIDSYRYGNESRFINHR